MLVPGRGAISFLVSHPDCPKTPVNFSKSCYSTVVCGATEIGNIIEKLEAGGGRDLMITERGTSFGYNNLIVDMRAFPIMRRFGYPVVFDVTHSLQLPGGLGDASDGQAEYVEHLARAGVACGVDGLFMEVHDNPALALSDAATQLALDKLEPLLETLLKIHQLVRTSARGTEAPDEKERAVAAR